MGRKENSHRKNLATGSGGCMLRKGNSDGASLKHRPQHTQCHVAGVNNSSVNPVMLVTLTAMPLGTFAINDVPFGTA
jgi:hypothetical protein